jgi:hypothetical protein
MKKIELIQNSIKQIFSIKFYDNQTDWLKDYCPDDLDNQNPEHTFRGTNYSILYDDILRFMTLIKENKLADKDSDTIRRKYLTEVVGSFILLEGLRPEIQDIIKKFQSNSPKHQYVIISLEK